MAHIFATRGTWFRPRQLCCRRVAWCCLINCKRIIYFIWRELRLSFLFSLNAFAGRAVDRTGFCGFALATSRVAKCRPFSRKKAMRKRSVYIYKWLNRQVDCVYWLSQMRDRSRIKKWIASGRKQNSVRQNLWDVYIQNKKICTRVCPCVQLCK